MRDTAGPTVTPAGEGPTVLAYARSTTGAYFGEMLAGVNRVVAASGGRLIVLQTLDVKDSHDFMIGLPGFDLPLAIDQIDGAVAMVLAADAPVLQRLRDAGKPAVLTHQVEGFDAPVVLPGNIASARAAVEHLVAHGHQRIGFVGELSQVDRRERYETYLEVLAENGLVARPEFFYPTEDAIETGGYLVGLQVARARERPTALVVATDRNAVGLLAACATEGVSVPGDIAVVGFDNTEAGAFTTPALTSVDLAFDEVGALAGRLLMEAIDGRPPEVTVHRPEGDVVIAWRGSCGCTSDGIVGTPTAADARDLPVLREELRVMLADTLRHSPRLTGRAEASREADAAVERLLASSGATPREVRALLTILTGLRARPDRLDRIADAIADHVLGTGPQARISELNASLWQLRAGAYLQRSSHQDRMISEQFRVATGLLHSSAKDPVSLSWLTGTSVRAGMLALWTGDASDGELVITGTYDPSAHGPAYPAGTVSVTRFPPVELLERVRPDQREACFVVPVQDVNRHWGLLALVGEIDTTSSRDMYLHWATLLASALEETELRREKQISDERYAHAARAANDGLWEIDTASFSMFASDRFCEILGVPVGTQMAVDGWLGRVHPSDLALATDVLERARSAPGLPVDAEFRIRHGDDWSWVLNRALGIADDDGAVRRIVGSVADIRSRKELEDQLRRGALLDSVTGLGNRRLFLEHLQTALSAAGRARSSTFAVIFLDLDGFKLVNDSLGHLVGDELLVVVAQRLRSELRAVDTAARFGGDEFAVLLADPVPVEVLSVAGRLQDRIAMPVTVGGQEVSVTASIGIALSGTGYSNPEDVLRDADIAMYEAKRAERGSALVFDPGMHSRAAERLRLRAEVRTALAERQFVLHYQPVVALDGAGLAHFEALVRWEHPQRGLLGPDQFLPAMEDSSSIVALGRRVLEEACRQIARWNAEGRHATVSVNVSHQEFWSPDLVPSVRSALATHGIPPEQLVVEITETVVMLDAGAATEVMTGLRTLGVRLHIDDFGTGQSSLHALRTFPVDALKIDGSFIRDLGVVEQTTELVRIIVEIGRVLQLDVVAEGVETPEQADRLRAMSCRYAQGWLYAKALPGAEAGALIGRPLGATNRPAPLT